MEERLSHASPTTETATRAFPHAEDERLAVRPRRACEMLSVGMTRLYELIGDGSLVTYIDGGSRRITTASIRAYVARRIEETAQTARTKRGRKSHASEIKPAA